MSGAFKSAIEARAALEALTTSIASGVDADRLRGFAGCLTPFLGALDWRGDARQVAEALPHAVTTLDVQDFRNILARLGFDTHFYSVRLREACAQGQPCVFMPANGPELVVLNVADGGAWVFESDSGAYRQMPLTDPRCREVGKALYATPLDAESGVTARRQPAWFTELLRRFRRLIVAALLLTFCMSLLSLTAPLGVMAIYLHVLPNGAPTMLPYIAAGVAACLGGELLLRALRARIQAYISGRMDYVIATTAFERVLQLPAAASSASTVGDQAARLRSFQAIRDFFSSPLASVALEMPFLPVSLLALAFIAGPVAIVPALALAIYAAGGVFAHRIAKRANDKTSTARTTRHAFTVEMLQQTDAIKRLGAESIWRARYRDISGEAAMASYRSSKTDLLIQDCSHIVMVLAGVATLAAAVFSALNGGLNPGALIAVMALTWRILSPIQGGLKLISNVEKLRLTARHLNTMMRLPVEKQPDANNFERKIFDGRIRCQGVTLRYGPNTAPALSGVGFDVPPGQFVAIAGNSGSGKSTLLKTILLMHQPQVGAIFIDELDIRQLPPSELRQAIAFMPQNPSMFYGTISQNLRLYKPSAGQAELEAVCEDVGILEDIHKLPEGFLTRFDDQSSNTLPPPFIKSLAIAGALLRGSNILLIDETHDGLDEAADAKFLEVLERLRGRATILMVTHRPSHMRAADRVMRLDEGRLIADGPPDVVVPTLFGQPAGRPQTKAKAAPTAQAAPAAPRIPLKSSGRAAAPVKS